MNVKRFLISMLVFNVIQLQAQYLELKNCINEQTNNISDIIDYRINSDIDVFDSIGKLEDYFLNKKLLKGKDQKSYQELIGNENIDVNAIFHDFQFLFAWNYEFGYLEGNYNACYSIVSNKNINWAKTLWPEKEIHDKIIAGALVDNSIMHQLSTSIEYNNDISRLMLCNLIFGKWVLDYKDEIFKIRKYER